MDAHFQAGLPLQQVVGYLPQRPHILLSVVLAHPVLVFAKGYIEAPVQRIPGAPAPSRCRKLALCRRLQAADAVSGLRRSSSLRLPAALHLHHRAQPGPGPGNAQVFQADGPVCRPALPPFGPSVSLVQGGGAIMGQAVQPGPSPISNRSLTSWYSYSIIRTRLP